MQWKGHAEWGVSRRQTKKKTFFMRGGGKGGPFLGTGGGVHHGKKEGECPEGGERISLLGGAGNEGCLKNRGKKVAVMIC